MHSENKLLYLLWTFGYMCTVTTLLIAIMHVVTFSVTVSATVTITSSPQLGIYIVCDMQLVNLTCHCVDVDKGSYLISWECGSNQLQHEETISVQAGLSEVLCMCYCIASDSGQTIGTASIPVVADGEHNKC